MITFLAKNDWGNLAYADACALGSVGVDAQAITFNPHPFNYLRQAEVVTEETELQRLVEKSDRIVLMHSDPGLLDPSISGIRTHARWAVFHGGSAYRKNYRSLNELFNKVVDVSLIQTGDLLGLGAKNEQWILPTLDFNALDLIVTEIQFSTGRDVIFAHYPRGSGVKGTDGICRSMEALEGSGRFSFACDTNIVTWQDNIRRMNGCDVYIAAISTEIDGRPYGGGIEITDIEAASLGKVVVTHMTKKAAFEEIFGECPFLAANNGQELRRRITEILAMERGGVDKLRKETYDWSRTVCGQQNVGSLLGKYLS